MTRVTYGLLNLTHRDSHEHPQPLEPGVRHRVRVELNRAAQRFSKGHRIRLSISTSYFPLAWPSPRPVRLEVHTDACALELPVRPPHDGDGEVAQWFEVAEQTPGLTKTVLRAPEHNWFIVRDLARERSELHVVGDHGRYRLEGINLEIGRRTDEWYRFTSDDVHSTEIEITATRALMRGTWNVRTETRTVLRCTEERFVLHATLDGYEGDVRVFSRAWNESIPRELI